MNKLFKKKDNQLIKNVIYKNVDEIITNDIDKIIIFIENSIDNFKNKEKLSVSSIIDIVPHLIKYVEQYKLLPGLKKKKLVIKIIQNIIDKNEWLDENPVIESLLINIVPTVIDTLIKVDKKQLKLTDNYKKCICC